MFPSPTVNGRVHRPGAERGPSRKKEPVGLGRNGSILVCVLWLIVVFGLLAHLQQIHTQLRRAAEEEAAGRRPAQRLREEIVGAWTFLGSDPFDVLFTADGDFRLTRGDELWVQGDYKVLNGGDVFVKVTFTQRSIADPQEPDWRLARRELFFRAAVNNDKLIISPPETPTPFVLLRGSTFPPRTGEIQGARNGSERGAGKEPK